MTYKRTPETDAIDAEKSELFSRRGLTNNMLKEANQIEDLHRRVAAKAKLREALDALDREEHLLNRAFKEIIAKQSE